MVHSTGLFLRISGNICMLCCSVEEEEELPQPSADVGQWCGSNLVMSSKSQRLFLRISGSIMQLFGGGGASAT